MHLVTSDEWQWGQPSGLVDMQVMKFNYFMSDELMIWRVSVRGASRSRCDLEDIYQKVSKGLAESALL